MSGVKRSVEAFSSLEFACSVALWEIKSSRPIARTGTHLSRGTTKIQPVGPFIPVTSGTRWITGRIATFLHSSGLATLQQSFRRFSPCRLSVGSAETLALHRLNNIKFSFRMIVFYYKGINRMWQEIFFAKGRLGPNSHKIGTNDPESIKTVAAGAFWKAMLQ